MKILHSFPLLATYPLTLLAATVPAASPTPSPAPPAPVFHAVTLGANSIHHTPDDPLFTGAAINASGHKFYVNRPTATYCPSDAGVPCGLFNSTLTILAVTTDRQGYGAALEATVPGGQDVYIDPDGTLSYTVAHSGDSPPGSVTTGIYLAASGASNFLYVKGFDWFLCPVTFESEPNDRTYQVFLTSDTYGIADCTRMEVKTSKAPANVSVWEYT